ncbi:MAG TPA: metallophosphoesterase [Myxococcota bacterium]|nr:metallophosphoesterase [Myxococcota bacterium]HRY91948.1 metallophosphoesterase [Myxococcota bacterium]HSA20681.1 metallophosphoesterase [Myxococcota bacterium]
MRRLLQLAVFAVLALAVLGGLHLYLWTRLLLEPGWGEGVAAAGAWALAGLVLGSPLGMLVARRLPQAQARLVLALPFTWLGVALLLLFSLLALDALRLAAWAGFHLAGEEAAWAALRDSIGLDRLVACAAFGLAGLGSLLGFLGAALPPRVVTHTLRLPRWPAALDGFRLVLLADLHLGEMLGRRFLGRVVAQVQGLRPDLVAVVGDLVDGPPGVVMPELEALRALNPPLGVWFTSGNHELYSGYRAWLEALPGLGLQVLDNRRVTLGRDGAAFELCGLPDLEAARMEPAARPDLARVLAGRAAELPVVLLSHQARVVGEAAAQGVELVLAGHNHAGQIWPFGYFVRLQQPVVSGFLRRGSTLVYVSAGTGFWGPPMRLFTRGEVSLLELRPEGGDPGAAP